MNGYATDLADEARVQLGRVENAWGWLTDARVRGATGPHITRPVAAAAAARLVEVWRTDRAASIEAARHGRKTGPVPAPGDLHVVSVRAAVAAELVTLATRMWTATGDPHTEPPRGTLLVLALHDGDPLGAPSGWWTEPTRWAEADHTGACPACRRRRCRCDRADLAAAYALRVVDELLDAGDVETCADADQTLYQLAELAERTVGLGPDRRRLPGAECPVCGTRELVPEVSSRDPRRWAIYCEGPDCRCHGPGCPCGIGTDRRRDRRHMWPAKHWDGPGGLAARLGVALPGTERAHRKLSA